MNCPNCSQPLAGENAFCLECGASLQPLAVVSAGAGAAAAPALIHETTVPAEQPAKRAIAYIVDCLPAIALIMLSAIPLVGILFAVLHCAYWALRDITGASPGKLITGSIVTSSDGSPATGGQRIVRNIFFAIPALFGLIPLVGWFIEMPLAGGVFFVEAIMLLATGRRIGDRLAGTTVIPKQGISETRP